MALLGLTLDNWNILHYFFKKTKILKPIDIAGTLGVPLKEAGCGAFREVFSLNYNWVIKNPRDHDSCIQNLQEYFISKMLPTYFAFCFLYKLNGIPVLICERVTRSQDVRDVFTNRVLEDGYYQTGYTQDKRFVCYDAGNENDLLNVDAQTMIDAFNAAPELCSYGELIDRIEEDWEKAKVNLPVIPYSNMMCLSSHLITSGLV